MTQVVADNPIHTEAAHTPVVYMGLPLPHGKLAMWLFLVTEIMFFTGLIGVYIILRNGQPTAREPWPAPHDVHLVEWLGALNTFVLICSSLTVVLAHHALAKRNVRGATGYIAVTLALGCVFLGVKAYEYSAKFEHEILPGRIYEKLDGPTGTRYIQHVQGQLDKIVKDPAKYTGTTHLSMWHWNYFLKNVDRMKAANNNEKTEVDNAFKADADFSKDEKLKSLHQELIAPRAEKAKLEAAYKDVANLDKADPKLAADVAELAKKKATVEKDYTDTADYSKIDPDLAKTIASLKKEDKAYEAKRTQAIANVRTKKINLIEAEKTKTIAAAKKQRTDPIDAKIQAAVSKVRDARKQKLDEALAAEIEKQSKELATLHPGLKPVIDSWELRERLPNLSAKKLNMEVAGDHHVKDVDRVKGYKVKEGLLEKYPDLPVSHSIPYGNMWASCYFAMTGFHAIHVIGGLVIFVVILIMAALGRLGTQHESMFELTGLYWHFVDIVWIFLFPLLYLV